MYTMTRIYLLAAQDAIRQGWYEEAKKLLIDAMAWSNKEQMHDKSPIFSALNYVKAKINQDN